MSIRVLELMDFLRDNLGKVLIALGIVFFVSGIMLLSTFYFELSALSVAVPTVPMFLGVMFIAYGFFVQVGLFSGRWRSINGLGTILLCISVAFFALALTAIQIQLVTGFQVEDMPSRSGGTSSFSMLFPYSTRPFLSLFGLGLELGVAFFVAGIMVKAFSFLRR
jgi:hypothetical protein